MTREELIQALERLQQTGRYTYEIRRRDRVEAHLAELLTLACSRHIQVAPEDRGVELLSTRFAHLPPWRRPLAYPPDHRLRRHRGFLAQVWGRDVCAPERLRFRQPLPRSCIWLSLNTLHLTTFL